MISLFSRLFLALCLMTLIGCQKTPATVASLDLGDILGGQETNGFERALKKRTFHFPQDHAAHETFRNEWWYLTGNVSGEAGQSFGYQVTFFRTAIAPALPVRTEIIEQRSNWAGNNIWMAHAAVTDINGKVHHHTQRFSRANPGLAGATIDPLKIWLEDWTLQSVSNEFPWQLRVNTKDFGLTLELKTLKNPVLQGDHGLSKKSALPGNASYYYSYTRMATTGNIQLNGEQIAVSGTSWFDREWSTSALDKNQSGWNWFSLQLDSGGDFMYYQLLDGRGHADVNSQGKWVDDKGGIITITPNDITLTVLKEWQSKDGKRYPIRWQIDYRAQNKSWIVEAVMDDQYMDLAVKYWEGAVAVFNTESQKLVGRGYLEMTRTR
ncbi:MAG: lipocalin-like domain-containing protein [Oceanicoccus sp.]